MAERADVSPLTLVFLGCGYATSLHSRTLARIAPQVKRFYASRTAARARAYVRSYGGSGWFNSYEAALADSRVDAVLVATPPSTHLQLTLAALSAGKHVIVEKPAFLEPEDCGTVAAASECAARQVLVAENYFYKPLARRLRRVIHTGVLGQIRFVHLNALKWQAGDGWRRQADVAGGGALFEGGIHWIDFIAHLGLTVTDVRGFRPSGGDDGDGDRSALVVVQYEQGAVGTLSYSWEIASPLRGLRISRIYGTEGSAVFESNGLFLAVLAHGVRLSFPGLSDLAGYRAMFRDFLHALRTGEPPRFTLALARQDLELARAASRPVTQRAGPISAVPRECARSRRGSRGSSAAR